MSSRRAKLASISLLQLAGMFPDEQSAVDCFESVRWPVGSAVKVFAETSGRPSAHHVITQEGPVRLVFQSQP